MAKSKTNYICTECLYKPAKWVGKCPNCDTWGTIEEEIIMKDIIIDKTSKKEPKLLNEISLEKEFRLKTSYEEFDRVLGGGLTKAEVVLITGAPGIGKSTFLLSLLNKYSQNYETLYISGEESIRQIKERADRIEVKSSNLRILNETRLEYIREIILENKPKVVVIDSIQTIYSEEVNSLPASVSQIRECSLKLIEIAKEYEISFYIV